MTHELLVDGAASCTHCIVLAHGAGAPMDSEFMTTVASGLVQEGVRVVRFEFQYMAERRRGGARKPPNTQARLLDTWREVVQQLGGADRLVIGGKSLGGRMASMCADELGVAGLCCLGYPFHPPGRTGKLRTDHLASLRTPALIVQGERDSFGSADEVAGYPLAPGIRIVWLPDGDHSFAPRARSGHTLEANLATCIREVARFVKER